MYNIDKRFCFNRDMIEYSNIYACVYVYEYNIVQTVLLIAFAVLYSLFKMIINNVIIFKIRMTSSRHSAKKSGNELAADSQLIVEEKIVKVNGETTVRKYTKGRFLGKVSPPV